MISLAKKVLWRPYCLLRKLISIFVVWRGRKKVVKYKDMYCGKRCFIIGNGPSLMIKDLEKLKDEITFGSHGIYYIFKDTDWRPTYYCAQDAKLINKRYNEIKSECNGIHCFFGVANSHMYPIFSNKDICIELNIIPCENEFPKFSDDLAKCAYEGFTVTYLNIQLAVYMGFSEIYLIGVDHNYSVTKGLDGTINYDKSVRDHFCETDTLSNVPNTDKSTLAYYKARDYADRHGIKIFNATRGGKLDAFERVDFDGLFDLK